MLVKLAGRDGVGSHIQQMVSEQKKPAKRKAKKVCILALFKSLLSLIQLHEYSLLPVLSFFGCIALALEYCSSIEKIAYI